MKIKRIGVLTGGGDCPGLNAVLRAVVKSAIHRHGWEVTGFKDGFRGLVEDWTMKLDEPSVSGILTRGGTILGTNNSSNPFAYTYDPSGKRVAPRDRSADVVANMERHRLDALVLIGGDGTLSAAAKIMDLGVPVIGVPKTIDNDLNATDITFGFDSALSVATDAVDRLHSTAEAHHRVMVLETMGRYVGWIALRAGIAGGGDVILIPEIPYTLNKVIEAIERRKSRGKEFTIIVVGEGAKTKDGELVIQRRVEGSPDPIRLGGVGQKLAHDIEKASGIEARVTVLGYLQRGGMPTPFDRWLATRFGARAMELLSEGAHGEMAALHGRDVVGVPIRDAVKELKKVDPRGEEVEAARATGASFGD